MGCCGRTTTRNKPAVDKRGNSLKKFAYLSPEQRKLLEAEEAKQAAEGISKEK